VPLRRPPTARPALRMARHRRSSRCWRPSPAPAASRRQCSGATPATPASTDP